MRLERLLRAVPERVQLLSRCRELNGRARRAQLRSCLVGGGAGIEPPRYGSGPPLGELRRWLEWAHQALESPGAVEAPELVPHYAARIQELALESQLAESVGTPSFAQLAARRFPSGSLSVDALCAGLGPRFGECRSVEASHPGVELSRVLVRWIDALGWPVRVQQASKLASTAAFGGGVIWVNPQGALAPSAAARIAVHELLGHALPALNAMAQPVALLRLGGAGGLDCQEGRAVLIEQRYRLLGAERAIELRARHVAALAWRSGAGLVEAARAAVEQGCGADAACGIALRVARGGGLCRELAYLQQAHAVRAAVQVEPALDELLGLGSVSLAAARSLASCGLTQAPRYVLNDRSRRRLGLTGAIDDSTAA